MQKLARWSFRHRWLVLGLWLAILVGARVMASMTGSAYEDAFEPPDADSTRVVKMLEAASPAAAGDIDHIVFAASTGTVTRSAYRDRVEAILDSVAGLPHVASVTSPFAPEAVGQVSKDEHVAYATVQFDRTVQQLPLDAIHRVMDTAQKQAGHGLQVELGGQAILYQEGANTRLGGEAFGLIVAAIVLFFAFGSLVAMGMPLVTAVVSLGTSLAFVDALSTVLPMADFTSSLASLIGLGVGIDYAMFIVSRYRRSLLEGQNPERATITAVNTSGRAVLFAGIVVCIALLGMFALRLEVFYGVAVGASLAVVTTMLAALTLQPALLGIFGMRVLSRRQRRSANTPAEIGSNARFWAGWSAQLQRHPKLFALVGLVMIAVLALPALSLRLGFSDAGNGPQTSTSRRAYDLLADGFGPGFNGAFLVVADRTQEGDAAEFTRVLGKMAGTHGVARATPARTIGTGDHQVQVAQLFPSTAPQDQETSDLLHVLRETAARETAASGLDVLVGGQVAAGDDFSHIITERLAPFIGLVIGLSFLLLTVVFRSLVVPVLAGIMNLLAVAAAFGVVTAVFQKGWLASVIGLHTTGPIEPFIPVIVFAVLFGLSMDYEVFIVARIHELWRHTKDNATAVVDGLTDTGRIITAAAAIMISVFGSFALGENRIIKLFGLGLASAVLIDALIIRTLVLPAVMLLLGRLNWSMPSALDRLLPRVNVEAPDAITVEQPLAPEHPSV